MAQYAGWLGAQAIIAGPLWHAHEMLFGYAFAVIVGFLFTAGRNWANLPTPTGAALAAIAALWLAARVLVFTPYALAAATADTAFAFAAAVGIAVPFLRSGNRRNYFFIALLLGMGLANLAFHLGMAGLIELPVQRGLRVGLDLVLFIMVVMGGRVIDVHEHIPGVACAASLDRRLAPGGVLVLRGRYRRRRSWSSVRSPLTAAAHAARCGGRADLAKPIVWICAFPTHGSCCAAARACRLRPGAAGPPSRAHTGARSADSPWG
jgi:uncharacterized protein involved in response to NO